MSSRLLYCGPPIEVLHEDYAKQGRIDERAPVTAARSVQIEAPPHEVWQVLSAGSEWPSVEPSISKVDVAAGVRVDAPFTSPCSTTAASSTRP